jgi:signal transduction histidine kinase
MNLENLSHQELINIFKESLEEQDEQSKKMAAHIHGEIFPTLMVLNMNIQRQFNALKKGTLIFEELEKDKEIIDSLSNELTKVISTLYPSLLKNFGLTKAMEGLARTSAEERSMVIDFENSTPDTKVHLLDAEALHIIKLFIGTLDLLMLQPQAKLTIQLRISDKLLHLNFKRREEEEQVQKDYLKTHFLDSKLKAIQARLLVLDAKASENTDWFTAVEIKIPIQL